MRVSSQYMLVYDILLGNIVTVRTQTADECKYGNACLQLLSPLEETPDPTLCPGSTHMMFQNAVKFQGIYLLFYCIYA